MIVQRILNRLKQVACIHEFGQWTLATQQLTSLFYGTTRNEVQRRTCVRCGWYQQAAIEEPKKVRAA